MEEKKILKDKWLHIRLDTKEHAALLKQYKHTTEPHLSKYARNILLGKPMIKAVRNESFQEIIVTLTRLQKDLNGLTNNYNQMVHKLHTLRKVPEFVVWVATYEKERLKLFESIAVMRDYISQSAEKWLL